MARGKQHVGLGKGLGDLFARTDEENTRDTTAPSDRLRDGSYFVDLPLDQIVPNPRQPRHVFDEDDLNELAHPSVSSVCCNPSLYVKSAPRTSS